MNARTVRNALVVSTLALVMVFGSGASAASRTSAPVQFPRFLWGAWIGDQFTGKQPPWDWRAVTDFQAKNTGGRHISVLHWGVGTPWDHDFNYWRGALDLARDGGVLSVVDMSTGTVSLRAIAKGAYDKALQTWATEAAAWGQPFLLRFDFEMNGGWFPWGTTSSNKNTPADFVAAWRHVHQIFTSAGATNVRWVWCPNIVPDHGPTGLAALYPGDSYVDWTCTDGYNFGNPWKSFTKIYARTYAQLVRIAPTKPILVGEVGSIEHGGNKANWITAMFQALATRFPHIHGLLWYDVYGTDEVRHITRAWPIETSRASSAAFRQGIGSTLARVCRGLRGISLSYCMGTPVTGAESRH